MAKSLQASTVTQIDAAERRPVLLFELGLSSTLRFAATISNVTFPTAGNTYTAKAIKLSNVQQSLEGQINRITVQFGNVAKDMAAYANEEDFEGKTLTIKRIFLDDVSASNLYNEVFYGTMERPQRIDRHWLTITATSGKPLSKRTINIKYQRQCPWIFGGTQCNTSGYADLTSLKATGTADSGSATTLVDNALTQAADYWNYGLIEIVKSGVTYRRIVKDFDADTDTVTWDVDLPFSVDNTCTYTIYKGCDQTWSTCGQNNAWGPSADNTANFGGFLHVGVQYWNWQEWLDDHFGQYTKLF